MANDLIYRTTASVVFWTKTTQQAQAKVQALESMTGADDGAVMSTIEWVENGKPPVPDPKQMEAPS